MKKNWSDFLKTMNHRFSNTKTLTKHAYEVDGDNGLRNHCYKILNITIHGMKACDYIYEAKHKYVCIEFTDLIRMRDNYPFSTEELDSIKEHVKTIKGKKISKKSHDLINSMSFGYNLKKEIAKKALDTDSLLINIREHSDLFFNDKKTELHDNLKPFIVIWNDPSGDDEISMVLDIVSDEVNKEINSLSLQEIEKRIYITTLSHFFS